MRGYAWFSMFVILCLIIGSYELFRRFDAPMAVSIIGFSIMIVGSFLYWAGWEDWLTHVGIGFLGLGFVIILVVGVCLVMANR